MGLVGRDLKDHIFPMTYTDINSPENLLSTSKHCLVHDITTPGFRYRNMKRRRAEELRSTGLCIIILTILF